MACAVFLILIPTLPGSFRNKRSPPFITAHSPFLSQQNYNKNNSWHDLWRDDRSLGMVSASQAVRSVHINPSHSHLLLLLPMHLCTIIIHPLFSPSPALLQRLSFTSYFQFTCSLYFSPAVRKKPSLRPIIKKIHYECTPEGGRKRRVNTKNSFAGGQSCWQ